MHVGSSLKTGQEALELTLSSARSGIYLFLVALSVGALALHVWAVNEFQWDAPYLRIDFDNSLSEYFEYAMLLAAAILLISAATCRRSAALLLPGLLSGYLLLDNWLSIHENAGLLLYPSDQHAGEIIFAALAAIGIFIAGWLMLRAGDAFDRQALLAIAIVLLTFSFFAVVVDAVHTIVDRFWPRYESLFGVLEDFGEMLSIALLVGVSARLAQLASPRSLRAPDRRSASDPAKAREYSQACRERGAPAPCSPQEEQGGSPQ